MNIIYKITNLVNSKIYIGSTTQFLSKRWSGHLNDVRKGSEAYFHKAIRKHGIKKFKKEIIYCVLKKESIEEMESYFIELYNSKNKGIGYNQHDPIYGVSLFVSDMMKLEWSNLDNRKRRIESMLKGAKKKSIIAVSIYGDDWKKFESINQAKREGFNGSSILNSLKRRAVHGQGYVWHYATGLDNYEVLFAETLLVLGDWKQRDNQPIQALDTKTGIKTVYPNFQAVRDAGFSIKAINRSLSGKRKIAQGFVWSYL